MISKPDATRPYCRVCGFEGEFDPLSTIASRSHSAGWRCEKHRGRNPCAIEGCRRSIKGSPRWHGLALWLCQNHWRLIAPHSAERRVYHRLFRLADKAGGFDDRLSSRYWRVWARLVARARARAAGDLDEAEIKRLFGW